MGFVRSCVYRYGARRVLKEIYDFAEVEEHHHLKKWHHKSANKFGVGTTIGKSNFIVSPVEAFIRLVPNTGLSSLS